LETRHRLRRRTASPAGAPAGSLNNVPAPQAAVDDLRFIRQTLENAGSFTAVPGVGQILMGATALVAAIAAARLAPAALRGASPILQQRWLELWLAEAALALAIGFVTMARKAQCAGVPLFAGAGRKFILGFAPPLSAGALLSAALYREGLAAMLPGTWLLLYGAAIVAGGAFSVRIIKTMGACFMAAGGLALLGPARWGDAWMAIGFGGLHIIFGALVARKHGG
jgi:hypothetical protein